MLDVAIQMAARNGGREVVIGAAHRGRLNILTHTVGVSYDELLSEFEGPSYKGGQLDVGGTGDVKYHHGGRGHRVFSEGESIGVSLAPNPSHLEFVNPVVIGMTRSHQFENGSREAHQDTNAVVPILMHGDAAFAAEGVVAETLNMARLNGYRRGRHHPRHREQPGRVHHRSRGRSIDPLLERPGQGIRHPDRARERGRPGGLPGRHAAGHGVPQGVRRRLRHRPRGVPALRTQRG